MAKIRTEIKYSWKNQERYLKEVETPLLAEGWYKINWNIPGKIENVKPDTVFFTVFERIF